MDQSEAFVEWQLLGDVVTIDHEMQPALSVRGWPTTCLREEGPGRLDFGDLEVDALRIKHKG